MKKKARAICLLVLCVTVLGLCGCSPDKDNEILDKLIKEQNLTGIRQIKKLIQDEFGVTYSERQISRIMNKLNFGYAKPYVIPAKSPEDAEEQLKKTSKKQESL